MGIGVRGRVSMVIIRRRSRVRVRVSTKTMSRARDSCMKAEHKIDDSHVRFGWR